MGSATLYRLSGVALLLGSLIAAVGALLKISSGQDIANSFWVPAFLLVLVGSTFLVLGLPAMFVQNISKAGIVGIAGFVLFSCALLILGISSPAINALVLPAFAHAPSQEPAAVLGFFIAGDIIQCVGSVVLGIALLRARTMPTWVGVCFLLSGVVLLVGRGIKLPVLYAGISPLLLYIVLFWSGYLLWSRSTSGLAQSQEASANVPKKAHV